MTPAQKTFIEKASLAAVTFYTYIWLRENGTPYYVGKTGDPKRPYRKNGPTEGWRVLVQDHESEDDAYTAEKFFIAYYGRKDNGSGILRNLTDGGEGLSGRIFSETHRARMKENNAMKNPEHRKKVSLALKGRATPWLHRRKGSGHPMWGKPNEAARFRLINDPPMRQPEIKAKWLLTRRFNLYIKALRGMQTPITLV